jgi:hypothetical protein
MKKVITWAILIALSAVISNGAVVSITAPGNITRNAGQSIPVTYTYTPNTVIPGQKADIYLINASTWLPTWVGSVMPVKGVNNITIQLQWGGLAPYPGHYVVKVVIGKSQCTGTGIVRIRSAVIWPYGGGVFTQGSGAWVTWTTPWTENPGITPPGTIIQGDYAVTLQPPDFLSLWLLNEDTGASYLLAGRDPIAGGEGIDPYAGGQFWTVPTGISGKHFRLRLVTCTVETQQDVPGGWFCNDILGEDSYSERIVIQ